MPIAEASLLVNGPVDDVFANFIDYRHYSEWMPKIMRCVRGPQRPLEKGDRFLAIIAGLPSLLLIERLVPGREICWSGGIRGVIHAAHTFHFESAEGGTRIRSVEPWTGIVTAPKVVSDAIEKQASRVGLAQLRGFEQWYLRTRARSAA